MTTRTDTRPRGVSLTLLDLSPVHDEATEWAHNFDDDRVSDFERMETGFGPWALMEDAAGNHWLVCTEGVAYQFTPGDEHEDVTCDDEPHVHLDLYGRGSRSKGAEVIGIAPVASKAVTLDRARELATGEQVDLADHVRVFGSRLEGNMRSLHRIATDEQAALER